MEDETWKDVIGYEGYYQVSSLGIVKSLPRIIKRNGKGDLIIKERILTQCFNSSGYLKVGLSKNSKLYAVPVHKLVADAFLPILEKHRDNIDHIDCNKLNNRVSNLRRCSKSENTKYAWENGLVAKNLPRGETQYHAKLKEVDVLSIRQLLSKNQTCTSIAKKYKVSISTINRIKLNRNWKHVQ